MAELPVPWVNCGFPRLLNNEQTTQLQRSSMAEHLKSANSHKSKAHGFVSFILILKVLKVSSTWVLRCYLHYFRLVSPVPCFTCTFWCSFQLFKGSTTGKIPFTDVCSSPKSSLTDQRYINIGLHPFFWLLLFWESVCYKQFWKSTSDVMSQGAPVTSLKPLLG